jgi:flagellar basal-body rod protein FlgB
MPSSSFSEGVFMSIVNPISALLARALDNAALRQAVHTSNIANAGVEGFRRLDVSFDTVLEGVSPAHVVTTNQTVRLDREMALMAKDAVQYQALLDAADRSFGLLRLAVREGKE